MMQALRLRSIAIIAAFLLLLDIFRFFIGLAFKGSVVSDSIHDFQNGLLGDFATLVLVYIFLFKVMVLISGRKMEDEE